MWFLAAPALADDLTWTCLTPSAPVDVHAWAPRLGWHGAGAAGRAAFATLEARVDAACLADCAGVEDSDCPARSCTTTAGDTVTWEATSERGDEGYGGWSRDEVTVRVEPDPTAGLSWTWAEITRRYSDSSSTSSSWSEGAVWQVAWGGTLDAAWPTDGAFTATEGESNEGDNEGWDDGTCTWSVESSYTWQRVTMGGHEVVVYEPGEAAACWGFHPDGALGGVAYVDGEIRGVVDAATWADAAGTDSDGDGWLVEEGDCDDADADVYCYAPEVEANGVDDDCNGVDGTDRDRDGWTADVDCNDTEDAVYPGAPDAVGDGLDSDCDGTDGPAAADTGGGDTARVDSGDTVRVDSGETGGGETGGPDAGAEAADGSAGPSCAVAAPVTGAWIGASFAAAAVARRRRRG